VSAAVRTVRAWRGLAGPQRLAAFAALALFVTMFLPWYTKDTSAVVGGRLEHVSANLIAWQAFSFVEAAVLLVVVAVAALLFHRADGRAFHLPGGDGTVIFGAGLWVCLLVFYRQLDKPNGDGNDRIGTTFGVTWGIFVTFLAGAILAFAGWRLRQAHLAEPPLPGDPNPADVPVRRRREPRTADRDRDRPRPEPDAGADADADATAVVPRARRGTGNASGGGTSWLGREGAARDLGRVGAAPDPDATREVGRARRRPPEPGDDEVDQLSFDDRD
jgi:multisubunit Na+/H+ antiporter MnhB subunit